MHVTISTGFMFYDLMYCGLICRVSVIARDHWGDDVIGRCWEEGKRAISVSPHVPPVAVVRAFIPPNGGTLHREEQRCQRWHATVD